MVNTEWRPIPGFPGYEVSDQGAVRSWRPHGARGTPPPVSPRTRKYRIDKDGYHRVTLMRDNKEKLVSVARIVCLTWHGEPLPGQVARHLDGCRTNNTPHNLAWGYPVDNVADAVRHGTHVRGVRVHKAKLTDSDVRQIYQDPRANKEIALDYEVTPGSVWFIKTKRTWVQTCKDLY